MILTDTHAHLYAKEFNEDIDAVIQNCIDKNINRIFLPNIDSTSTDSMLKLAQKYPANLFPMMGIHPCSIESNYKDELAHAKMHLENGNFCAIGEIGIDLFWDKTFVNEQKEAFRTQIKWAKEMRLPIIIHARDSFKEIFEIVDEENDKNLTGIFHCFTGSKDEAEKIVNYGGFKLGVGGVVTFKNSGLDKVLSDIDVKHLVLETDSPYLAPTPYRGKRNESTYLENIALKLCDIYGHSLEEIANITTENSKQIFGF